MKRANCIRTKQIEKKRKGMLLKFHSSKSIGVLTSTKSGQKSVQSSTEGIFKIKLKYPDKKFYFFACNTLDPNELENFPFIDCWISTMCPRIREDLKVLNLEDLE